MIWYLRGVDYHYHEFNKRMECTSFAGETCMRKTRCNADDKLDYVGADEPKNNVKTQKGALALRQTRKVSS
jgi:hypothetical protein